MITTRGGACGTHHAHPRAAGPRLGAVAHRPVGALDRPRHRSRAAASAALLRRDRWCPYPLSRPLGPAAVPGRAGGDLPRPGRRPQPAPHRHRPRAPALDHLPRGRPQRRPRRLPSPRCRHRGLRAGEASEDEQARREPGAARRGRAWLVAGMVTGADQPPPAPGPPRRPVHADQPGGDLPQPLRPAPRSASRGG
jgi:hypothetical protein